MKEKIKGGDSIVIEHNYVNKYFNIDCCKSIEEILHDQRIKYSQHNVKANDETNNEDTINASTNIDDKANNEANTNIDDKPVTKQTTKRYVNADKLTGGSKIMIQKCEKPYNMYPYVLNFLQ